MGAAPSAAESTTHAGGDGVNPFGRNLIKNPCGEESFDYWTLEQSGGDGWIIERPPVKADDFSTVPKLCGRDVTSCFATSYKDCVKHQVIDLVNEGFTAKMLDKFQPDITVIDWYASRADCSSKYCLQVSLLDKDKERLTSFTHGPVNERQWAGGHWHKVKHRFQNYGSGLRHILFRQIGSANKLTKGHCGSKMTASTVRVHMD